MPRRRPQRIHPAALVSNGRLRQGGAYLISLVMLAITLWMLTNFIGQVLTSAQLERRKVELEAENARLEAEKFALEQEVAYAESPAYAEQIARDQLGLARDGDTVIMPTFPDQVEVTPTTGPAPLPAPTVVPNWQAWHQALFPADQAP